MACRFTRNRLLAILAALPWLAGPACAWAGESFDFGIVTTAPGTGGEPHLISLKNGDLLRSGASFRVELIAHAAGSLDVVFVSSQGEEFMLAQGLSMAAGGRLALPDAQEWYQLDKFEGIERVMISFSGDAGDEAVEHVIRHVSPELFHADPALDDAVAEMAQSTELAGEPEARNEAVDQRILANLAGLSSSVATYRSALERVGSHKKNVMRGAKEAKLFRELSPGVVMVVGDDGIGSGAIISEEGLVVTNWHVVQGSENLGIIFKPPLGEDVKPSNIYTGVVEKVDAERDLALVRVVNPPENLTLLALGEMQDIEVGSDVHAIGHPTGEGWTYTKGFISQVRPNYQWPNRAGFTHKAMVIQTQTPISPGSSGSPLINEDHKVIGINSFKKQGEALNFAISVADVRNFLSDAEKQPATAVSLPIEAPLNMSLETEGCTARSNRQDIDGDGQADRIRVDSNCDGKVNLVIVDENKDGKPDFALADRDADGKPDLKMVSTAKNGRFDLWLIDSDGDGSLDMVGYDDDTDGTIDRYARS